MKYAGIDVKEDMKPAYIWSLDIKGLENKIGLWNKTNIQKEEEKETSSILKLENINFSYDGIRKI